MLRGRLEIVVDVLKIELNVAAPLRHRLGVEDLEGFESKLEHPLRLFFDLGDLPYDFFVDSFARLEDCFGFRFEIVLVDLGRF